MSAARKCRSCETSSIVPSKPRERADQHLLGREVEVVGRLVEHQEVRRVVEHARQHEARLLAAREQAAALLDLVAREAEAAGERAQRADRRVRERALERLPDAVVAVEQLHRVLREVAELHRRAERDAAGVGRGVAGDELEQRRLAGAVHAHHAPALAAADPEVEAVEDDALAVGLVHAGELHDVVARARRRPELELDASGAASAARPSRSCRASSRATAPAPRGWRAP